MNASQNNKSLLLYQILFHIQKVFFFLQINSGISCTAEVKVNKGFLRVKMLLSIVNLTCKRFAKNLGSKVTSLQSRRFCGGNDSKTAITNDRPPF